MEGMAAFERAARRKGEKMKRLFTLTVVSALLWSGASYAADPVFLFGEETKGASIAANEADLNIRIRLQPRFDYGDIIKEKDGNSYAKDADLYLRRVRLELGGSILAKTIKYKLTLSADKWEKAGNTNEVALHTAYIEWEPSEEISVIVGKAKLPYSRVSLTSSSSRLLIENPASTEGAKKLFGPSSSDPYHQPTVTVKGRLLGGVMGYEAAVADGWQNGETVQAGRTVFKAGPFYGLRLEISPPGWIEGKKSDAHLGKGRHMTLGLHAAKQGSIEYNENVSREDRTLAGFDLSGHYEGLTAQFEYNGFKIESDDPAVGSKRPKGFYLQGGYFIAGPNIEPAFRYEVYDQDSDSSDKKEKTATVGVNWYLKGHSLKVGANWAHTKYDAGASGHLVNDDTKDVLQVQGQMYF